MQGVDKQQVKKGQIKRWSSELYELRIHEDAEKGSRLTMGPEMQKRIEKMGGCFGQLDTDIDWVEYR